MQDKMPAQDGQLDTVYAIDADRGGVHAHASSRIHYAHRRLHDECDRTNIPWGISPGGVSTILRGESAHE